jgi:hypothetical protein
VKRRDACQHAAAGLKNGAYRHPKPRSTGLKVGCLVAGMTAGAGSIEDMDVLRHGAMADLFGGIRAPSTLGSFLRSFTWGNARQLEKVHREFLFGDHPPAARCAT